MNKTDLIAIVSEKAEIYKKDAEKAVNATIDTIIETVAEGKEIRIVIDSLGCGDKGMYEPLVEGPWELVWTPSVNSEVSCFRPDTDIGNTGIKLVSAEIAPVSAKVILALPAYWDGYETLESYDLQLAGVRLEDGTVLTDIFGYPIQEGYADIDNLLLELIYSSEHILRPGQVDALLFAQGYPWTKPLSAEELIVVPVT